MAYYSNTVLVDTETTLLKIDIFSDWTTSDFISIFELVKQSISMLNNARGLKRNLNFLQDFKEWSKIRARHFNLISDYNLAFKYINNGLQGLEQANAYTISLNLSAFRQNVAIIEKYFRLENEISQTLFNNDKNFVVNIVSVNYNSPGSIITGVPEKIAGQTNDLLNTILFYSKRKKELELKNELSEIEVDSKRSELENKKRLEILHSINEDLAQSLTIIKQLGELREALHKIGATEEESLQFVKKWLLDRLDVIFPTMHKVSDIELLEG